MKRILGFCCLLILVLSFTGCDLFNSGSSLAVEDEKEWTIMVWLDGDNNLNEEAVVDFHQMEYGLYLAQQTDSDLMDHINVIVQYDGSSDSDYNKVNSTAGRYKALPASSVGDSDVDLNNKIQNLEEPNMGSAEDLGEFIDFCKHYYPAENYGLILWNHGGGVRSFEEEEIISREICFDDSADGDALYIGEIKDELDSTHSVDFLGMDACLMGYAEVAYEFRPGTGDFSADYFTASPATEQVDGWEYQMIFNRLCGSGYTEYSGWGGDDCYDVEDLTAEELATIVVEEYGDAFSTDIWETMTAVDLSKMEAVKSAVDAFAEEIANSKTTIETVRGAVGTQTLLAYFDDNGYKDDTDNDYTPQDAYNAYRDEWYYYAGFDLYELAEQVKAQDITSSINTAADTLMGAVDDAVVLSWAHSGYGTTYGTGVDSDTNGLAIFFPDGDAIYANGNTYWYYQDWYNGVDHDDYAAWATSYYTGGVLSEAYGALDFLESDSDGTVESWFELMQYWYNPSTSDVNGYNPGMLE